MFDFELMRRLSTVTTLTPAEIAEARAASDYQEPALTLERAPSFEVPDLADEAIKSLISDEAKLVVIGFEVTGQAYYEKHEARPTWPQGASGVTIGIGYDLGYNTPENVR